MGAAYPDLDLSQIIIDNIVLPTPGRVDTVSEETGDSIHTVEQGAKDADAKTVIQPTPNSLETPAIQLATVPSAVDGPSPVDPTASQVPSS